MIGSVVDNRYSVSKKLSTDIAGDIFLATDASRKNIPVCVRAIPLDSSPGRIDTLIKFRRDLKAASRLNHPHIIAIIDIIESVDHLFLVTEFFDGISLRDRNRERQSCLSQNNKGKGAAVADMVELLVPVCRALDHAHAAGIIHRGLNPGAIMLAHGTAGERDGSNEGQVQIAEFGIFRLRDAVIRSVGLGIPGMPAADLAEQFGYRSPEQLRSGLDRIDERSDLYSLGLIWYELITGHLPFQGADIRSLVLQQTSMAPPSITAQVPEIPRVIEAMVFKLLEKDPHNRYQSAAGLLNDLLSVQRGERDFVPGREDRIRSLKHSIDFIGRKKEFEQLTEQLCKMIKGTGSMALIAGEAGIGKSRMVGELRRMVYMQALPVIVIQGRCEPGDGTSPYTPFAEALGQFFQVWQGMPPEEQRKTTRRLHGAIGELGGDLLKLNPLLEEMIGPCPPLTLLNSKREMDRFFNTVVTFFNTASKIRSGLVLVVEDMQWIDNGSGALLIELVRRIKQFPLFIIGTYRDDELPAVHVVRTLFTLAVKNQYPLVRIQLSALEREAVHLLCSKLLCRSSDDSQVDWLSSYIYKKSNGNPIFAMEMVKFLFEEGFIAYDQKNQLLIDRSAIQAAGVPDIFVDILLKRIATLDDAEQALLSLAAAIGGRFALSSLIAASADPFFDAVLEMDRGEHIGRVIDRAVGLHLLTEDLDEPETLSFTHDLIREAVYRRANEEQRKKLHRAILEALERVSETGPRHYQRDHARVSELAFHAVQSGDGERALRYSYPAGVRARQAHAYEDAVRYFSVALMYSEMKNRGSRKWREINRQIGDIYLIIGKNVEAIQLLAGVLPCAETALEKAYIYKQISRAWFNRGDFRRCEQYGAASLRVLGERLYSGSVLIFIGIVRELAVHIIQNCSPIRWLKRRPSNNAEKYALIIDIYYGLCWSFVFADKFNFVRATLRMMNIAQRRFGASRELARGMSIFGALCFTIYLFRRSQRYLERSLAMRQRLGDKWGAAQSLQLLGFAHYYKGEFPRAMDYFQRSTEAFRRMGDMTECAYSLLGTFLVLHVTADTACKFAVLEEYRDQSEKIHGQIGTYVSSLFKGLYYIETARFDDAENLIAAVHGLTRDDANAHIHCLANIMYGRLCYERGDIAAGIEYLERARDLDQRNNFMRENTNHLYRHLAFAYMLDFMERGNSFSREEQKRALQKIKKACGLALKMTRFSSFQYSISLTFMALYHALARNDKKAEKIFAAVLKQLKALSIKRECGIHLYYYGLFLKQTGRPDDARIRMMEAYAIFEEIGCTRYRDKTADFLGIGRRDANPSVHTHLELIKYRDRLSLFTEIVALIKSGLPHEEMLNRSLALAAQLAGAERGCITLRDEHDEYRLSAVFNSDPSCSDERTRAIINRALGTGMPVRLSSESGAGEAPDLVYHENTSILALPIIYQRTIIGACYLENSLSATVFTDEVFESVQLFVDQISIAIGAFLVTKNIEKSILLEPSEHFYKQYAITEKERDIIMLFLKGYTRNRISKELSITYGTTKWHINNIYRKIGVANKTELIDCVRGNSTLHG